MRVPPRCLIPVVAVVLALPATAGARGYTVRNATEFRNALTAAGSSSEADTIQLAAGTYTGQFEYDGGSDVTITGAGRSATTLANAVGNQAALRLHGSGRIVVQDLGVSITGGTTAYGFQLDNAGVAVEDVQIVNQPAAANAAAVVIYRGSLRRATISGSFDRAVWAPTNDPTSVDALTITGATTALEAEEAGTMTATHVQASGVGRGAAASFGGTLIVTDSLLRLSASALDASDVGDYGSSNANASHLVLARDTLVAGGRNQRGVAIDADRNDAMTAVVTDTALVGFTTPLQCSAVNGGSATITTTNAAYASGVNELSDCLARAVRQTGTIVADPQFANPAAGDYRPRAGSPLIDVDAAAPAGATDLDGHPRPADGSGDCVRQGDVGAYELLRPLTAAASADRASAPVGTTVTFTGAGCDAGSTTPPTYRWTFDDGTSANGAVVAHAFVTLGPHVATVTVTDAARETASASASVLTTFVDLPPPPPGAAGTLAIQAFRAPSSLTLGRGAPRLGGRAGHALSVTLSAPATVTLSATRLAPGRRTRGGRCVSPKSAPHGRACRRRLRVRATASLSLPAGRSLVAFAGRMTARAALQPGVYELTLTARDAAGHTAGPSRVTVTLRKPARRLTAGRRRRR